jgi:N-acetylglucosamine-6-phosphate deacetylase
MRKKKKMGYEGVFAKAVVLTHTRNASPEMGHWEREIVQSFLKQKTSAHRSTQTVINNLLLFCAP